MGTIYVNVVLQKNILFSFFRFNNDMKNEDEIISLDLNINQGSKWLFFFFLKWTYWMMKNTYSTSIVLLISFSLSLIFIGFFSLDFFNCVEFSFLDFCDPFSWKKLSLFISKCRKLNFEFLNFNCLIQGI